MTCSEHCYKTKSGEHEWLITMGGGGRICQACKCAEAIPKLEPRARTTDPQTSHDAARSMTESADSQRQKILLRLTRLGPMTADELDHSLGLRLTSSGRRLPELLRVGWVERLPEKRLTRSGRQAHLWKAREEVT